MKSKQQMLGTLFFLLPALALFSIFLLNPIIQAVVQSFFSWKGIASVPMNFVGFKNYGAIFSDEKFWQALLNSFRFMLGGFVILMPLAFLLAVIITSDIPGIRFFKTSFFMPVMLPLTAVGLMWVYILEPNWGLVNSLLSNMKLDGLVRNWLGTPKLNVWIVILVNEWIYAGLNMLIFAAGLVSIPQELYEAAVIDGASPIQKLFRITLPMMKNSFIVFSVLCVTGSLKTFDLMYSMTQGGPNRSSEIPATLLYNEAFVYKNFGKGNAIGTMILIIGLLLSLGISYMLREEKSRKKVIKENR